MILIWILGIVLICWIFWIFMDKREGFTNTILLGDSILQNSNYVKKSVPYLLSNKCNLTTLAQDGATINDVYRQLDTVPGNLSKSIIFVSAGGNDLINYAHVNDLIPKYKTLIESIQVKFPNSKIVPLNLYYPPNVQNSNIKLWNNFLGSNFNIIHIDKIMNTPSDFINNIEPSESGSNKIAGAILNYILL
jgi:hypothetical protein